MILAAAQNPGERVDEGWQEGEVKNISMDGRLGLEPRTSGG